jgi:hypothetical protein
MIIHQEHFIIKKYNHKTAAPKRKCQNGMKLGTYIMEVDENNCLKHHDK